MSARDVIEKTMEDWWVSIPDQQTGTDAILSALSAAGYAVIPVEPTEAMINANDEIHWDYNCHVCGSLKEKWRAMLKAAKESK